MGLNNRVVGAGERFVPDNIYAPNPMAGAPAAATVGSSTTGSAQAQPAQTMAPTSGSGIRESGYKEQSINDMPGNGLYAGAESNAKGIGNTFGNLAFNSIITAPFGMAGSLVKAGLGAAGINPGEVAGKATGWNFIRPTLSDREVDTRANAAGDTYDPDNWDAKITNAQDDTPALGLNTAQTNVPTGPYTGPKVDDTSGSSGVSSSSGTYGGLNTGVGSGFNSATWGMGSSTTSQSSESSSSDYAEGGMVGLQTGVPVPQGAPQRGPRPDMHGDAAQGMIARAGADPKIKQMVQQAVQSGKLDPQQLHMAGQLAQACIQNPSLWPQLRQFAVQKGLCGPNDLPAQYNQRLVMSILAAAKAAEGMLTGQQGQVPQQGLEPPPGMGQGSGGLLHGPGTGTSDSIPAKNLADGGQVNVSDGEYVIPAKIVRAKGKDFFDSLIRKYSDVPS